MRLVFLALCAALALSAQPGRVFFISLDGLGHEAVMKDAAAQELTAVHALRKAGASADGLTPAFPSTTANSHAALWTGTYAGRNGILYNRTPALPRSEHAFTDRVNGFRSENLSAEPIWLTAARQGVSVVAHQVTQAYPFLPQTVGDKPLQGFTMVNGYQSRNFEPWRILRKSDVKPAPCENLAMAYVTCYEWTAGGVVIKGALVRDRMLLIGPDGTRIAAMSREAELEPPTKREIARYWSKPLALAGLPDGAPASITFRLFQADPTTGDFVLLQAPVQETALYADGKSDAGIAQQMLAEAGPMIGNGAQTLYGTGALGNTLEKGGNGLAERRYLETLELVTRQLIAHSNWLFRKKQPRLHITYSPFPDETEHTWLGLDRNGGKYTQYRRWAFAIANRSVEAVVALAGPQDHIVLASDHGMTPVHKMVNVNLALERAGLKDRAVAVSTCVLLNSTGWKSGIVKPEDRASVLDEVEKTLRAVPAVTEVYRDVAQFGLAGPGGADLCYDLAPDHAPVETKSVAVVEDSKPRGVHGLSPLRRDMEAVLAVRGPRAQPGSALGKVRGESVAPLICSFLGIAPPANATGVSPIRNIEAVLQHRVDVAKRAAGIVVAELGPRGTQTHSRGVPSTSMFEIGSITKTFTALLLCDMAERGELTLTDPVAKYLPPNVKMPSRGGKEITLLDLAMHVSGLPRLPSNMAPANYSNPYADYDSKKLYEFLSTYELDRDIGAKWEYSNVGAGLLGHVLALRSGMPYEDLLRKRLLDPLGMKQTTITLSAAQRSDMAPGHNMALQPAPGWDLDALAGAGAIRSTAADMLKYMAAHLELTPSPLQPAIRRMRSMRHSISPQMEMAIGWLIDKRFGREIVWHNGGTGGYRSYAGFDPAAKTAVVVLTNTAFGADDLGRHLLDARYGLDKVTPLPQ